MNEIVKLGSFVLVLVLATTGMAAVSNTTETPVDKRGFNFFNPTPPELLRDLLVDGPAATQSPYTVDAGHFQIEMAFVDFTTEDDVFDGVNYQLDWVAVAPFTIKVGLLNSLDLHIGLEPYNHVYEREVYREPGYVEEVSRTTRQGLGDTTVRLKYNLWGNDRGATALAVTPFVKLPTSVDDVGSDIIEGGVSIPFAASLTRDFHLGFTTRFVWAQDILGGQGSHNEFANSISFSYALAPDLELYIEFFSNVSTEQDVGWIGKFDSGFVLWLTDDFQLNAGVNVGLTKWADDLNLFAGFAWRY